MGLFNKFRALFRMPRMEAEMDDELRFHLEKQIEQNVANGMSGEQARYAAMRQFGNLGAIKEECRDSWGTRFISELAQDIRFGLRQLRRNPGFTIIAILTLALGIGANTCIFSIVNGLFLRGLPVPEAERVVSFSGTSTWKDYVTYRDEAKSFASLSASYVFPFPLNLNSTKPPRHIDGQPLTGNSLSTLGIKPVLGRGFLPYENKISSPTPVVMLSYKLWRTGFGGDPHIVGKTIQLDNKGYTVVGVMPSDFRTLDLGLAPDLWAPMPTLPQLSSVEAKAHPFTSDEHGFYIFGRLKPGVSRQQALAEVNLINDRLHNTAGKRERRPVSLTTAGVLPKALLGRTVLGLSVVLMVVAGLVLLIACVNIASLVLARATSRRKETAVRLALGAGRGRMIRQLMTENFILAFLGAAVGYLLALPATHAASRVHLPLPLPIVFNFTPDLRVLLLTAGLALLTSLIFGLAPSARATGMNLNASLNDSGPAYTDFASQRTRKVLVMVQVAVSVVVLVAGGLFLRSLQNGFSINLGFKPENLLVVKVDPTTQGYSRDRTAAFFQQLERRVSGLPGVLSASVVAPLPLSTYSATSRYSVPDSSRTVNADMYMVGPRYFETMGIPLLRGRGFRDVPASSPRVAVVNLAMAKRLFPNEDPVGKRTNFEWPKKRKVYEIIGVAGNTKSKTIGEAFRPCIYELSGQNPKDLQGFTSFGGVSLVVKTVGEPRALVPIIQQQVENLNPGLPVYGVETMQEQIGDSLVLTREATSFMGAFGLLALALAGVGLYGLMRYTVVARTREIGIRMAMGAERRDVLKMVVRQGLKLALVGVAIGIAGALALTRFLASLLYGVKPTDPLTFIAVSLILIAVAIVACYIPARRAAKVDPMVALRYE